MAPTRRQSTAKGIQNGKQVASKSSAGVSRRNEQRQQQRFETPKSPQNDDSMDIDEPTVKLKTFDKKRFTLSKSQLSCSNALQTMIQTCQNAYNSPQDYINLDFVDGPTLEKVLEWWRIHKSPIDHPNATCSIMCSINMSESEKSYLSFLTEEQMLKLIHAANYLNIERLFDSCCRLVAKRWETRKVHELRKLYDIKNDFSPEEENQIQIETDKIDP